MAETAGIPARPLGLTLSPVRPWKPSPFRRGPSPYNFAKAAAHALGQRRTLSGALFDDPLMATFLTGAATLLAAAGTATFENIWLRVLAWGVLIGAGAQTIVNASRVLGSPQ